MPLRCLLDRGSYKGRVQVFDNCRPRNGLVDRQQEEEEEREDNEKIPAR